MQQNEEKLTNGDVIYHTTITNFTFWDRIKILLGKKLTIHSEIFTTNEIVNVTGSKARNYIGNFFPGKKKYMTYSHKPNINQ
jgi:hypothetical protein